MLKPGCSRNEGQVGRVMKASVLLGALVGAIMLGACIIGTATPEPIDTEPPADTSSQTATVAPTLAAVATPILSAVVTPTPQLINVDGRTVKQFGQLPVMTIDPNGTDTAELDTVLLTYLRIF